MNHNYNFSFPEVHFEHHWVKMSFYCEENVYLMKLFGGKIMKYLFHSFLFLLISVGFVSCDDVDLSLEENQAEEVLGLWKIDNANKFTFVFISNAEFNFYELDRNLDCVETTAYQVIKRDGSGFFQVQQEDGSPIVFAVTNQDGQLRIRSIDDPEQGLTYYWPTTIDVTRKTECLKETDIQGKWEFTNQDGTTYVDISDDSIKVISEIVDENCFEIIDYRIDGRAENIYKLIDEIATGFVAELFVEIKRTQTGLEITLEEDGTTNTDSYRSSNVDLTGIGPDCGLKFPGGTEGIWEFEAVANTAASLLHLEMDQDTLRYYTKIVDQGCIDINNHPVRAKRSNTYFLSDVNSETVDLIYQIFFETDDVLITRITDINSTFDERFIRSTTTIDELESNICTIDF